MLSRGGATILIAILILFSFSLDQNYLSELSAGTEIVYICAVQYDTQWPHVAPEPLKCDW